MAAMENLVTDHLDLWTSAIKRKSAPGRGTSKKIELYGIKKLRELILQLAVMGKLIMQDTNDEPASELLKKIAAQKAKLVKEGKVKKEKPLPPIRDEEEPFNLPSGWSFQRLGEILTFEYGDNLPDSKRSGTGEFPVYGSNGVVGSHNISFVNGQCIVIGRKGSAGALNLCLEEGCCVTDVAYYCIPPADLSIQFIFKMLHTHRLDSLGKGIKPGLNRNDAYGLIIAVPPLAEQHRIVAKVDELMALCDQVEQQTDASLRAHRMLVETLLYTLARATDHTQVASAWQRIAEHFHTLFITEESIDHLKQTILQLAVMGKLVPQDANDEPASELLKKIAAEKAKLAKEGRFKKEITLPPIKDEEEPFNLPSGWSFQRLGEILTFEYGDNLPDSKRSGTGEFPVYGSNGVVGSHNISSVNGPCIVIGRKGSAGALNFCLEDGCCVTDVAYYCIPPADLSIKFVFKMLHTHRLDSLGKGIKPGLNRNDAYGLIIAIPPLAEQHRIVAKVGELMALCDQLKSHINEVQTVQLYLADALTEKALAKA